MASGRALNARAALRLSYMEHEILVLDLVHVYLEKIILLLLEKSYLILLLKSNILKFPHIPLKCCDSI